MTTMRSLINEDFEFDTSPGGRGLLHLVATGFYTHSGIRLEYMHSAILLEYVPKATSDIESLTTAEPLPRLEWIDLQAVTSPGVNVVANIRLIDIQQAVAEPEAGTTIDNRDKIYEWLREKGLSSSLPVKGSYLDVFGRKIRSFRVQNREIVKLISIVKRHQIKTAYALAKTFSDYEDGIDGHMCEKFYDPPAVPAQNEEKASDNDELQTKVSENKKLAADIMTICQNFCHKVTPRLEGNPADIDSLDLTEDLSSSASELLKATYSVVACALAKMQNEDLFFHYRNLYIPYHVAGSSHWFYGSSSTTNFQNELNCAQWCKNLLFEIGLGDQIKNKNTPWAINHYSCTIS